MEKNLSIVAIAEKILKHEEKSLDIYTLFDLVSEIKEYSQEQRDENLALFHTYLTTDGRFVILHDGTWSLRENHPYEMVNAISTDFELFEDEETIDEDEDEYEALDVLVVTDEEELEAESKNIKNLIGYEESEAI